MNREAPNIAIFVCYRAKQAHPQDSQFYEAQAGAWCRFLNKCNETLFTEGNSIPGGWDTGVLPGTDGKHFF